MKENKIISNWRSYFVGYGLTDEIIEKHLKYISGLVNSNVPIIFDFSHLSKLLGRTPQYLASAINSPSSHYREFRIPKRSGGERIITAPYPALMECQYWIYHNILKRITIHPAAHGFAIKKSILSNAKYHLGQNHYLKVDIKDFFPSITINRVVNIFQNLGYTNRVSFYLAALCCLEETLPQGAPTSPAISNIVAHNLDNRLYKFAKRFKLSYTRYADDLAFSGSNITVKMIEYISNILKGEGFLINEKKTRFSQKKGKRILTGISIAGEKLKVPGEYKRKLRQEIHYIRKFGQYSHIKKLKIKNPNYVYTIIGRIRFWLSVEPEDSFAQKALIDLLELTKHHEELE